MITGKLAYHLTPGCRVALLLTTCREYKCPTSRVRFACKFLIP